MGQHTDQAQVGIDVLAGGDVALLRAVLKLFGEVFEERETYTGAQPGDDYLRDLLAGSQFVAVAARAGDEVVGALAAYVLPKFEQARTELYIYDLAVREPFRRRGVATRLIDATRKLARERGIYVMYVQADHGDDPAIALYTKLGVREDVLHFDIAPWTRPADTHRRHWRSDTGVARAFPRWRWRRCSGELASTRPAPGSAGGLAHALHTAPHSNRGEHCGQACGAPCDPLPALATGELIV